MAQIKVEGTEVNDPKKIAELDAAAKSETIYTASGCVKRNGVWY